MSSKLKIALLALTLIVAAFTGWKMNVLSAERQLWGYLPLLHFIAGWTFIRLAFAAKWQKNHPKWRWLGLSTFSGILLAIGFPNFPLTPLLFIAFIPLLVLEEEVTRQGKSAWEVFKFSYNTFAVWNILATYWVANTAFLAGIIAIFLNALLMTMPFMLFHWTKKYVPRLGYLAFIAYWLSFEMLHLRWEISWSWLNLGNAFAEFPSWIQWYEFTGIFGGSLWVLLLNVLIFQFFNQWQADAGGWKMLLKNWKTELWNRKSAWLKIKLVALVPLVGSLVMYFSYKEKGRQIEVAVIQPNFEPHYEKFDIPDRIQLERFLKIAVKTVTPNTEYLVFPETSFGMVNIGEMPLNPEIQMLHRFLKKYPKLKLVTGVNSFKIFNPEEPSTPSMRITERNGEKFRWELYNGAIQLTSDSTETIPHYKKSKLVPGPEILPYKNFLGFLEPIFENLDGSVSGHGTQKERTPFVSDAGKVAPVICYESVFGEYHTGYIKQGAEATFIMTNDGWWDKTAGHRQHLKFASLRSIETRRATARSANTGISAFLNQRGDILQPTKYAEEAGIRATILFNDQITFYVKWGDIIGRIAAFTSMILLLNFLSKALLKRLQT